MVHSYVNVIAVFDRTSEDGYNVMVGEYSGAKAWRIYAWPCRNSAGTPQAGFVLSTGTGGEAMKQLVLQMAKLIADGMLGSDPLREESVTEARSLEREDLADVARRLPKSDVQMLLRLGEYLAGRGEG